eukprot:TRINITY_DN2035_c0_g1_i1.p1 TRINITY_DN2035_c0_g1~~TRINITY_DN2035_c0_g1_i1.p1  ORF type:complete len:200 (+),score=55.86 TRINITY_DN2035_c0_g1_i1:101-700(+)
MQNNSTSVVIPGRKLGRINNYESGIGTYVRGNSIFSSVVGYKTITEYDIEEGDMSDETDNLPIISVTKDKKALIVPIIESIVTGKVSRVNTRYATVKILCCDGQVLSEGYLGIIRVQDIRATEVDKAEIYNSFRPGDIVKAEVLSLGDARSYFLTTGKNELGVIFAKSVSGATMIPISWEYMQCTKTKMKEPRKVAKVI